MEINEIKLMNMHRYVCINIIFRFREVVRNIITHTFPDLSIMHKLIQKL